jgi:hypothetical protein
MTIYILLNRAYHDDDIYIYRHHGKPYLVMYSSPEIVRDT